MKPHRIAEQFALSPSGVRALIFVVVARYFSSLRTVADGCPRRVWMSRHTGPSASLRRQ